jgi:hypothetical protein
MALKPFIIKAQEAAKSWFALILLLGLGGTLIYFGSVLPQATPGQVTQCRVITAVGGVFFGSGLSLLFNAIYSQPFDRILQALRELAHAPWRQSGDKEDKELIKYRQRFYGYLYTKRDGEWVWLYRVFDFGGSNTPGMLYAMIQYQDDPKRDVRKYEYFGFTTKNRLVLIGHSFDNTNEPAVIHVFPDYAQDGLHAGLAFVQAEGKEDIITPSLMSNRPLIENLKWQGRVGGDHSAELLGKWEGAFSKMGGSLPPTVSIRRKVF